MNLTEGYTFKKIQKERPVKNLNACYDQLHRQYEKLDKKCQEMFKELKELKGKCEVQERELIRKQRTVEGMIEEKCELSQLLSENKAHIRKLESKITIGNKGQGDVSVKKQLQLANSDRAALEKELNEAYEKIEELEDHIAVISQALEVKASDLGNVNPLTLLTIGENKELMNKIKDKERQYEVQLEEHRINLSRALDEIDDLKAANLNLSSSNSNFENKLKRLEIDKKHLEEVKFT